MNYTEQLLDFIRRSPTCYHVCQNMADMLLSAGYTEINEAENLPLQAGAGYFIRRNMSSIIAFRMPPKVPTGFMICASHGDSPSFKIKDNAELASPLYVRINAEPYGGMISSAWLDRPLSAAGKLIVRDSSRMVTKLVNVEKNLLMIPNVAPHMARIKEYNPACDLVPLFGDGNAKGRFFETIAACAGVHPEDILSCDLFLYNRETGFLWGTNEEFLSAPQLDDLQCAYSSMAAFLESPANASSNTVPVCAVFDNEEVGSTTKQGAASTFLSDTLHRIIYDAGKTEADYLASLARSMMISADNAHAVHPNHPEYADPTHRPEMNRGIVIKHNAAQKYTTDAVSAALFAEVCKHAEVPVQHFFNRSDMGGGSTLGNIANTQVSLNTVDIGLAQLAMHSPMETAGAHDTEYLIRALRVYYGASITAECGGAYTLTFA
ncbi:MAG: M18 family aminopeptidase [Clostridia bacterium]|nr:M18 family aminopeptidase [Clostridia bacterium]